MMTTLKHCFLRSGLALLATVVLLSFQVLGQLPAGMFYHESFEGPVGSEWSIRETTLYPYGSFLGQFSENDTVTLSLTNLPAHTNLVVAFDLMILKSWRGNNTADGLALWEMRVAGSSNPVIRTTFANDTSYQQSYPENYLARHDARTGAEENNTLGFRRSGEDTTIRDSIYRPVFRIPHTNGAVRLQFSGTGLGPVTTRSWGLDNVSIGSFRAPDVTLEAAPAGGFTAGPASVELAATVVDSDSIVSSVEFLWDGRKAGERSAPPFSLSLSNVPAGTHRFAAVAISAGGERFSSEETELTLSPTVLPPLAQWRYLDDGAVPDPAWTQAGFDDSTWHLGFGKFGYGQGDEDTLLRLAPSSTNDAITAYLRTSFVLKSTNEFTNDLTLRALIDGGVVARLNGEIIMVAGLDSTAQPDTLATNEPLGAPIAFQGVFPPDVLVVGTNVLTVELHITATNDPDAVLQLFLETPPVIGAGQPEDQVVVQGGTAEFYAVGDFSRCACRWQRDGIDLPGETNGAQLVLTNVQPPQAGRYRLRIETSNLVTFTRSALLEVQTNRSVLVESTFLTNREGWSDWDASPGRVAPITRLAQGGRPGGYLSLDEVSNGDGDTTYWVASANYLGDQRNAFGGTFEFTARQNARDQQYGEENRQCVVLMGAGKTIAYDSPYRPSSVWTHFEVPLLPSYWRLAGGTERTVTLEEMLEVLGNLDTLRIRAEYRTYNDIDALDSVRLVSGRIDALAPLFVRPGTNNTILIHWPASCAALKLQSSSRAAGGAWSDVSDVIAETITNGLHTVVVPAAATSSYFRLVRKP